METEIITLLECAIKAPSGHNTQPWKFTVNGHTIEISPDYSRRLPILKSNFVHQDGLLD